MATYRVLFPTGAPDPATAADRAKFLREGFSWLALLFGPVWLLARRLWGPLALWCLAAIVIAFAISAGRLPGSAGTWLYLASALFLGLEGHNLVGAAMERRGFALVDVIAGVDRGGAEEVFFSRWLAATPNLPVTPPRPNAPAAQGHIIGLFPEAGG